MISDYVYRYYSLPLLLRCALRSFALEEEDCNGLLCHPSAQGDSSLGMTGMWLPDLVQARVWQFTRDSSFARACSRVRPSLRVCS
jgi:hypothetical protein